MGVKLMLQPSAPSSPHMRFNPETGILTTDRGEIIKKLHCPLDKRWGEMRPIGIGDRERACTSCGKTVLNLEGMTDEAVVRRVRQHDEEQCVRLPLDAANVTIEGHSVRAMARLEEACPLRKIATARGFEEINRLAVTGLRPFVVQVPEVSHSRFAVWQHRETGEIVPQGDARWSPNRLEDGEYWEQVIGWVTYNHGVRKGGDGYPVAAYMLPGDLRPGDRVWIDDIIEPVVKSENISQGGREHFRAAGATWTGRGFDFDVPEPSHCVG